VAEATVLVSIRGIGQPSACLWTKVGEPIDIFMTTLDGQARIAQVLIEKIEVANVDG
jgi:hypothetical protein